MAERFETYRGVVYPWEMDHVDHMNVQFYTAKFDQATWHFFARLDLTPSFFREQKCGMAAVQQNTTYRQELHAGDLVMIETEILEISEKTIRFLHSLINAESGGEAARSELTGVFLDRVARKSQAFPAQVRAAAEAMLAGEPAR